MKLEDLNFEKRFFFAGEGSAEEIDLQRESIVLPKGILESRRFYFGFVESQDPIGERLPAEIEANPDEDWHEVFDYWGGTLDWEIIISAVEAHEFLRLEEPCGMCITDDNDSRQKRMKDLSGILKDKDQAASFAIYLNCKAEQGQAIMNNLRLSTWHFFCLHEKGLPIIKGVDIDFLDNAPDYFEAIMQIDERALVRLEELFSLNHVPSATFG